MHEHVEEKLKEVRAKGKEDRDESQQDMECQVFNIGVEDDLDIDSVMHQIQSSGEIEEFSEYYDEVFEKKKEGVPTARALHLAKKERARKRREEKEEQETQANTVVADKAAGADQREAKADDEEGKNDEIQGQQHEVSTGQVKNETKERPDESLGEMETEDERKRKQNGVRDVEDREDPGEPSPKKQVTGSKSDRRVPTTPEATPRGAAKFELSTTKVREMVKTVEKAEGSGSNSPALSTRSDGSRRSNTIPFRPQPAGGRREHEEAERRKWGHVDGEKSDWMEWGGNKRIIWWEELQHTQQEEAEQTKQPMPPAPAFCSDCKSYTVVYEGEDDDGDEIWQCTECEKWYDGKYDKEGW